MKQHTEYECYFVLSKTTEKKKGRFDVMVEDGDEVLVGASGVSQTNVSAHNVFGLMFVLYV